MGEQGQAGVGTEGVSVRSRREDAGSTQVTTRDLALLLVAAAANVE